MSDSDTDSVTGSVTDWLHSLEHDDSEAVQRLWDRYFSKLVELARHRAGRSSSDGESIASSVFASLWRGAKAGRFRTVQNRDELWWLLLKLTRMKISDAVRERTAQKRGGNVTHVGLTTDAGEGGTFEYVLSQEPTPDDLVALDEEFARLLSELRDDQLRRIAIFRMEGYSREEIADEMGISTATVTRKLRLIRCTWAAEFE